MNGQPWKAGKFAYSLRCSLWSEHLGLQAGEVGNIDETFTNLQFITDVYFPLLILTLFGESQIFQINQISDPVLDTTYKNLWLETAKVKLAILL